MRLLCSFMPQAPQILVVLCYVFSVLAFTLGNPFVNEDNHLWALMHILFSLNSPGRGVGEQRGWNFSCLVGCLPVPWEKLGRFFSPHFPPHLFGFDTALGHMRLGATFPSLETHRFLWVTLFCWGKSLFICVFKIHFSIVGHLQTFKIAQCFLQK